MGIWEAGRVSPKNMQMVRPRGAASQVPRSKSDFGHASYIIVVNFPEKSKENFLAITLLSLLDEIYGLWTSMNHMPKILAHHSGPVSRPLLRLATAEHLPCARVLGMAQESSGPTLVEVLGVSPKIDGFYMVLSFVSRVLPCFFKVFFRKNLVFSRVLQCFLKHNLM